MSRDIFCSHCAETVQRKDLLDHIEKVHVGNQESDDFQNRLVCGRCEYQGSKEEMMEHCLKISHPSIEVSVDWTQFIIKETDRIRNVIGYGIELLHNSSSPNTPFKNAKENSCNESQLIDDQNYNDDSDDLSEETSGERLVGDSKPRTDVTRIVHLPAVKLNQFTPKRREHDSDVNKRKETHEKKRNEEDERRAIPKKRIKGETYTYDTIQCKLCDKNLRSIRIMSSGHRLYMKRSLLAHAISHTHLKVIQCLDCATDYRSEDEFKYHRKKNPTCSGKWKSLMTDEKRYILKAELAASYPGIDFEDHLQYSSLIGNNSSSTGARAGRRMPLGPGPLQK